MLTEKMEMWIKYLTIYESIIFDNRAYQINISLDAIDQGNDVCYFSNSLGEEFTCPEEAVKRTVEHMGGEEFIVSWQNQFGHIQYA